jgi:hypothetical protein
MNAGPTTFDAVQVAQEAHRIFEDAKDEVRVRWMNLELGGYGPTETRRLHEVLRVPQGDRLVAHVAAYRTQRGAELAPDPARGPFTHFFVEALSELVAARDRVRQSGSASDVELDFGPGRALAGYPARATFPRDVFERIVGGALAALYLQLGSVVG